MKIAVIGASGKAGSLIVDEAIARGHEVTAFVRDANKVKNKKAFVFESDLFDLKPEDLEGYDSVVDAFGFFGDDQSVHVTSLNHIANLVATTPTRLLVVGGAGSLYVDEELTTKLMDTEGFPAAYLPMASNMGEALKQLRMRSDVKWTYFSPAADFRADGERTGSYTLAGEILTLNSKGDSVISYADYAIAMVDEIEQAQHIQERISVVSK
ncbi:NAD(P)-dependent oxidoreductase [Erysipelothrix sp. HDW6B]|uniref:NAD(P)-dependent oxidoreductase n=1 Tax=Erysipelothrix sp. HDW6B TaxID=2714929 RepID=UPI00140D0462|nr:NAD(P)-dependent oxidoreductase [Erysipelothrix sp. HDW6B]QIK86593.1 NAD(P)-dependent oxidoreductase [Erysipelothrix sp. HDW6B]